MKKKIFATLLAATTILSLIGCGNKNEIESTISESESTEAVAFEDFKKDMDLHVAYFEPIETAEGESTKHALSLVTKASLETIQNVDVELKLVDEAEEDNRSIESSSCAVLVNGNYYILTYAMLENVESLDECEYVVSQYVYEESHEDHDHAEDTDTTESTTENETSTEDTNKEAIEEVPYFALELVKNESVVKGLDSALFKTDTCDMIFLEMGCYDSVTLEDGTYYDSFLFLMHPVTGYHGDADLENFSIYFIDETPESVLNNFEFTIEPYDAEVYEKDVYFTSLYPCLNIQVTYNATELTKEYEDAESIISSCIAYIGVRYEGESSTFTYVPSTNTVTYENAEVTE